MCYVEEQEGQPLFKVKVVEKGYDDLILTGPTPKGNLHKQEAETLSIHCTCVTLCVCVRPAVWEQVLEPVSQMRSSSGTLKLFPVYLKGEDLFGLTTSAVTRIIESVRLTLPLSLTRIYTPHTLAHRYEVEEHTEPVCVYVCVAARCGEL